MSITAYTDYPIEDGTSEEGMKEVQVLSYDRNKYCTVLRNGFETEVKAGYIYLDKDGKRPIRQRALMSLPHTPEDPMRTRHQLMNELKRDRKRRTWYYVHAYVPRAGGPRFVETALRRETGSRAKALKLFTNACRKGVSARLSVDTSKGTHWIRHDTLMDYNSINDTWDYYGKKKPFNHKTLAKHGFKV